MNLKLTKAATDALQARHNYLRSGLTEAARAQFETKYKLSLLTLGSRFLNELTADHISDKQIGVTE
jgi:hypothetical protein